MHPQRGVDPSGEDTVEPSMPSSSCTQAEVPACDSAAGVTARADEDLFAEALQASEEMQTVASYGTENQGVDRIDAILLEEIEAEAEAAEEERSSSPSTQEQPTTEALSSCARDNSPAVFGDRAPKHARLATLWWSTLERAGRELAAAVAAAVLPLLIWLLLNDTERGPLELCARPFYAWWAARAASLLAFDLPLVWFSRPMSARQILLCKTLSGWPLTLILTAALSMLAPKMGLDESAWRELHEVPHWWSVVTWWMASGVAYVAAASAARLYVSALTSQHYEQRARDAYQAQKVLRKISYAASRARKASVKGSTATATRIRQPSAASTDADAVGRPAGGAGVDRVAGDSSSRDDSTDPARYDLSRGLAKHLQILEGPLQFGAGLADVSKLSQVRRRATRLFDDLVRAEWLHAAPSQAQSGETQSPVPSPSSSQSLSRERLLQWAYEVHGKGQPIDRVGAAALFGAAEVLEKEQLISSVERCYKEQRLLIASVASFDQINMLLVRCCVAMWAVLFAFFYLVALGVAFNELLLPSASLIISVILLMGRAPSDFMSGALYVLLVRPYDIGDRITLSQPGRAAELYSLVVKGIGLLRTRFLTSHGELLYIDNAILRTMTLTNLTRSGPLTLCVPIDLPLSMPAAKLTELIDSIRKYVEEKSSDWSGVDVLFSATDFEVGRLVVHVWLNCVHPADEPAAVFGAKSSFLLFVHAYTQSASIEYLKPTVPVRITHTQGDNGEK